MFNICLILSFSIILMINRNTIKCRNVDMPIQAFDFIILFEQILFTSAITVPLCCSDRKTKSYFTTPMILALLQLVAVIVIDIIGTIYLVKYYDCFKDVNFLLIFTLVYLIVNSIYSFLCAAYMCFNHCTVDEDSESIAIFTP